MNNNLWNDYLHFVDAVTSEQSKDQQKYISRINELYQQGLDVARFNTAADGLSSEAGEFMEIKKKIMYQGKPFNEENKFHLYRELGDIAFYFANACMALGFDPEDVLKENIRKLESRYPGGKFTVEHSENRKEGDI